MKARFVNIITVGWCSLFIAEITGMGQNWTNTITFDDENFHLASSADGYMLITGGHFVPMNYTSTNAGTTWYTSNTPVIHWVNFASSSDGNKLVGVGWDNSFAKGLIYTSTNAGSTWISNNVPNKPWVSVSSSTDGNKLVAAAGSIATALNTWVIYSSSNGGAQWVSNNVQSKLWQSVASSADGNKIVACSLGSIYTSTNAGAAWVSNNVPNYGWVSVASSADGNKLVAVSAVINYISLNIVYSGGGIYTSTSGGAEWISNNVPNRHWRSVASSADGNKLVAVEDFSGGVYTTTNAGASWVQNSVTNIAWTSVVSSADGNRLAAAGDRGSIYVSDTTPMPSLSIAKVGSNTRLCWIIPSLPFTLQQNTDLTTTNWMDVTNQPIIDLNTLENVVVLPLSPTTRFYRLKSSP